MSRAEAMERVVELLTMRGQIGYFAANILASMIVDELEGWME